MASRLHLTLRTIPLAVVAVGILAGDTASAQPGVQAGPPSQSMPDYGGAYGPGNNVHLLTPEEREILWQGEIGRGQTIGGGLLAAWIGFGVGHALQGRYLETGWKFTVGEAAAYGMVLYGAIQLADQDPRRNSGAETLLIGGVLSFGILRVWEVVDTLVAPSAYNRRYRAIRSKAYGGQSPPRYGLFVTKGGAQGGGTAGFSMRF